MQRSLILVSLVVGLLFVAVGCGGGEDTSPTATATSIATPTATTTTPDATPTTMATTTTPSDGGTAGSDVFASSICITCHIVDTIPAAIGIIGPDLSHIGTVAATRVSGLSAEDYIRQSIEAPLAFVVPSYVPIMPTELSATFSSEDFEALIAFLVSLQ